MQDKNPELHKNWNDLLVKIEKSIGKKPTGLKSVLFLIGVHELGKGVKKFSKEDKQDLIHIAICKVLSYSGYYVLEGKDKDGWPHWKSVQRLPYIDILDQEVLLKKHILKYFDKEVRL